MPGGLTTGGNNRVTVARKDDENRKEYSDTAKREVSVDVDALLAASMKLAKAKFIAARTILNTLGRWT